MSNILNNIKNGFQHYFLKRASLRDLKVYAVSKGDAKSKLLQYEAESLQAKTFEDWKIAILTATDSDNPDKTSLADLYKNMWLDDHLESVVDSRILYCQRSSFKLVNDAGDENKDISWLFERTWFEDYIRQVLLSRFEGVKVLEIFEVDSISGELKEIEEIPMQFVNTKKGIILKSPGDTTGWQYKEGILQNYYMQIGKDKDLGMFWKMAPTVLAKKLGFGSWLDYLEKYGVGNLFITTDREDDERLNQLAEAAANFKSSGYMVGRGNEKFEVKGNEAGRPETFDLLIERANKEISKRVLGGSGLTDDKSFVGSSEIQYKLAKDRFESDKLLLKNVINQQLIPRLIKLSPVYQVLNGYSFEWDNSEAQTLSDTKDMVTGLAPHFELDTEEVAQRTGFKIIRQKNVGSSSVEYIKKKSLK